MPYCNENQLMEKVNFKQKFYGRDSEESALLPYFVAASRKEKGNTKKVEGKRTEKITQSYFNRNQSEISFICVVYIVVILLCTLNKDSSF